MKTSKNILVFSAVICAGVSASTHAQADGFNSVAARRRWQAAAATVAVVAAAVAFK